MDSGVQEAYPEQPRGEYSAACVRPQGTDTQTQAIAVVLRDRHLRVTWRRDEDSTVGKGYLSELPSMGECHASCPARGNPSVAYSDWSRARS